MEESVLIWRGDQGREELEKRMRKDGGTAMNFCLGGTTHFSTTQHNTTAIGRADVLPQTFLIGFVKSQVTLHGPRDRGG